MQLQSTTNHTGYFDPLDRLVTYVQKFDATHIEPSVEGYICY